MIDLKEMGERIRRKRIELNLTQEELAKQVGYTSRSSINKIELGLVNLPQSKIISIANALNVSVSYVMGTTKLKLGARINKNIAHNIRLRREQAGLTQRQFADMLGIDEKAVIEMESGRKILNQEVLYLICDALQLIPGDIMPRDDEELDEDAKYLLSRFRNNSQNASSKFFLSDSPRSPQSPTTPLNLQLFGQPSSPSDNSVELANLTVQEKTLVKTFRGTTEEGRMKIIQATMNICDEIESKNRVLLYAAAESEDHHRDQYIEKDKKEWEQIKGTPNTQKPLL